MKETQRRLQRIPNVGPAIATALLRLGITDKMDLAGRDPADLYGQLCCLDAKQHDPCVQDVFAAAISFANGNPPVPWWTFSRERKAEASKREDEQCCKA